MNDDNRQGQLPIDLPGLPRLFTIPQLAEYFGVSVRTVEGWNSRGGGPRSVKIGRHVRYTEDSIREYLASRSVT
ncbi:excisionase family DNA binding protein [Microbacterium natoriense]|uniref:Excisionase family DNA binding protein n=2 Tax=Microbacterium natoriense TaxID=284570 RepID=A0AAW8EVE3_9MICO|nr:excisionase family DNA binding protein [Microbacterium natoriense]